MTDQQQGLGPPPKARGRPFQKGNGGRPRGSRNRTSVVAEALLRDEEAELVRTAVKRAKSGDAVMLKFLLGRLLPKERTVRLELPLLEFARDSIDALDNIVQAVSRGEISPAEGAAIAELISAYSRSLEIAELERRLERLERAGTLTG